MALVNGLNSNSQLLYSHKIIAKIGLDIKKMALSKKHFNEMALILGKHKKTIGELKIYDAKSLKDLENKHEILNNSMAELISDFMAFCRAENSLFNRERFIYAIEK